MASAVRCVLLPHIMQPTQFAKVWVRKPPPAASSSCLSKEEQRAQLLVAMEAANSSSEKNRLLKELEKLQSVFKNELNGENSPELRQVVRHPTTQGVHMFPS
eukprot:GDKI01036421.1.p1 GENE.GDKI01036421.1~~GDKI01036421.1.p1  ORF type:complete len:102 (-),score=5.01 GDKI01036421.1:154-459(-)